jgi:predicted ABC-type ATPase
LVIIAGPNGCGKSTIASSPSAKKLLGNAKIINPDTFTADVLARGWQDRDAANLHAVVLAELAAWRAVAENQSVAIETVLSTDKYLPLVAAAVQRGFLIALIYIALPNVDFAIARVKTRVQIGGHDVPESKIRERWPRSIARFVEFMSHCSEVVLFSNAGMEPKVVGLREAGGQFELKDLAELPEITTMLRARGLLAR